MPTLTLRPIGGHPKNRPPGSIAPAGAEIRDAGPESIAAAKAAAAVVSAATPHVTKPVTKPVTKHPGGRPALGDKPMTSAERTRRHRARRAAGASFGDHDSPGIDATFEK